MIACKKDKPQPPEIIGEYKTGVLVLNEGLYEQNNASITFFDGSTTTQQVFKSVNDRGLGDTANDFVTLSTGDKNYIIVAVDISSQIEVLDRYTLESVIQFPMFEGINAREPRRVVVRGAKAYVCNFDGTVAVVDLNNLSVESLISVGANPDGMAIVDDQLYVSNSGGLNFPVYDSTISVIDLASNSVVETINTRINSTQMVVDNQQEIYLVSNGNYDDIAPALVRINTSTNSVESIFNKQVSSMQIVGDWLYFYNGATKSIERFHTISEIFEGEEIIDLSEFETFHGMVINHAKSEIYCIDANNYVASSTVNVYNFSGALLRSFTAGLNATDLIFNN